MNLHDRDNFRRGLKEGIAEGIAQGSQQAKIETAKNLLNLGDSLEKVAQVTGLSIVEINNLAK